MYSQIKFSERKFNNKLRLNIAPQNITSF